MSEFCQYIFLRGENKGSKCTKLHVNDSTFCSQHKSKQKKCIHGKNKYYCVDCCGSMICEHG